LATFRPFFMDIVCGWCEGKSFAELCEKSSMFEGSIIRCMRRLFELVHQLELAAQSIGNEELEQKMTATRLALHRGVVFAASLYTLDDM
jgi:ATP-dependent RNA helicase DOB1